MGKKVSLLLFCLIILITAGNIQNCASQNKQYYAYKISTDGIVTSENAPIHVDVPIQQTGNIYVLTDDVGKIRVERSNIVLDGNGHTLPGEVAEFDYTSNTGGVYLNKVENVTVKNLIIQNCDVGVYLIQSKKCTIANNTITGTHVPIPGMQISGGIYITQGDSNVITGNKLTNNYVGVGLGDTQQNIISQNEIKNNSYGIWSVNCIITNNRFCLNNFFNNTVQAFIDAGSVNFWDSGKKGNCWSDYNGTDANGDGIGDTPYLINENNLDHYPIMMPPDSTDTSQPYPTLTPEPKTAESFPMTTIAVASVILTILVSASLIVYFKKHRRQTSSRM